MKIIDFHTHPFMLKKQNTCFYNNIVDTPENFKDDIISSGICHICGSVIEKVTSFEDIHRLNKTAIDISEKWKGFYTPGIHIHPDYVKESIEELYLMRSKGIKLIGELVPYYNGWESYYNKNMHQIYEIISQLGFVVSIHTQNDESIIKALENFPNIPFVGAHPRDKEDYYNHIYRLKKYNNYYMDLSGTGLFRYGMVKNTVRECGSSKILFGTDYPICNPKMYVEALMFEKISYKDKENIFYKNASELLDIDI